MNDRNAQLAQAALQFINRAQIQGQEVPAFVEVHNWLQAQVNGAANPEVSNPQFQEEIPLADPLTGKAN